MPPALQHFHGQTSLPVWSGEADIEAGHWFLPKLVAWVFGFPRAGRHVPVSVSVDRKMSKSGTPVEHWIRSLDGQTLTSRLTLQKDGRLTETFWPFRFALPVQPSTDGIRMPVASWRLGKMPLPGVLAPRSETSEFQDPEGHFCFDVRLSLPGIGLLAHYRGWLRPIGEKAAGENITHNKRTISGHGRRDHHGRQFKRDKSTDQTPYPTALRRARMYFAADRKWLGPAASAQRPGVQLLFAPFMGPP